ncbi:DNA-3-methyladenine glycosylase family protein [Achromobacter aloeverae]|uniref:DNA-3-methyladenine glycosylase II n=1 Tax=Achromobacter aloeverae TaxID=1750518 RepID=A0A4Q1HQS5_9BURK|nr:DNA-3-methyladenine glycosylase [Achromobacter aloeverae]RXN93319.1 DNA-3-methyladenine glycosylase [Achromobacter aloeverae]
MSPAETPVAKPHYWEDAVSHLLRRDRILKKLIPQHPEVWLTSRSTPFVTLARAIIGQQVSARAADTAWQRLLEAAGARPSPAAVLRLGADGLRAAGIAQRKADYLHDLATHFSDRKVHPDRWSKMDDEAVVNELVGIRGISRWTAEMFLIFNLQRPDVLPLDDPGLLKAISLHYFSGEPVSRFEAREVSLAWQPWRTVATWYLWHSLEPVPVQY